MKSIKKIHTAIITTMAILFLTIVYGPMEVYFANIDGFTYDVYDLLRLMFPTFVVMSIVAGACFYGLKILNNKLYRIAVAAVFVALIATYFQGNFLSSNLPPLDGTVINWSDYDSNRLPSVLIWVVVSGTVFISVRKMEWAAFEKLVSYVSGFLLTVLIVSSVLVGAGNNGFINKNNLYVSDNYLFELGDEENFVILLLDNVEADVFAEELKTMPEYYDSFEDFTLFSNALGAYPRSKYSIPLILSGEWYTNKENWYSFKNRIYCDSPLFSKLEEHDYSLALYEEDYPDSEEALNRFINTAESVTNRFKWPAQFIKTQIKLCGLKYCPYDLKKFCILSPEYIYSNTSKSYAEDSAYFNWNDRSFYLDLLSNGITHEKGKRFSFIHLEGAHIPHEYDESFNDIGDSSSYETCVRACIKMAATYVDSLRSLKIYDNTVVIIMADHGSVFKSAFNPLLMIKGKNESHSFFESVAPVSYDDLQIAYERLLAGCESEEAFDCKAGDIRERRCIKDSFYSSYMEEYIQCGLANDSNSFIATGLEYAWEDES